MSDEEFDEVYAVKDALMQRLALLVQEACADLTPDQQYMLREQLNENVRFV